MPFSSTASSRFEGTSEPPCISDTNWAPMANSPSIPSFTCCRMRKVSGVSANLSSSATIPANPIKKETVVCLMAPNIARLGRKPR